MEYVNGGEVCIAFMPQKMAELSFFNAILEITTK